MKFKVGETVIFKGRQNTIGKCRAIVVEITNGKIVCQLENDTYAWVTGLPSDYEKTPETLKEMQNRRDRIAVKIYASYTDRTQDGSGIHLIAGRAVREADALIAELDKGE